MLRPALNCDLGEGTNNEGYIMPLINSCSIACGGHAGDLKSMENAIMLAKENKVFAGAHPSFPDRENFGRVHVKMNDQEFVLSIRKQLNALDLLLQKHQVPLHHIKPHGALYNEIAIDSQASKRFLNAIREYKSKCFLYVPFGSMIERIAKEQGFAIKYEAFGDRCYMDNLSLMPRTSPGAVIRDKKQVYKQIRNIWIQGKVETITENKVDLKADTFCIHSDTTNAVVILKFLQEQFQKSDFG